MPVRSDEPLRKVTLNLYEADCVWLEKEYGHGWSERVRQHISNEVESRRSFKKFWTEENKPKKLGDLPE